MSEQQTTKRKHTRTRRAGRPDRRSQKRLRAQEERRARHTPQAPPPPPKIEGDWSGQGFESVFRSVLAGYLSDGHPPQVAYSRAAVSTFRFAHGVAPTEIERLRTRVAAEVFEAHGVTLPRSGVEAGTVDEDDDLNVPRPAPAREDARARNLGKR